MTRASQIFGGSGPMNGAPFIGYDTGLRYPPHYLTNSGTSISAATTRAYYAPFFVAEAVTFTSIETSNLSAAENGNTYRCAVYANDGTAGPGTLIQDIGQVTLTAAAAVRSISATINLQAYAGQWVWIMVHFNQASTMENMTAISSTADYVGITAQFGAFSGGFAVAGGNAPFRRVDTAYGAAASTAVTPTAASTAMPLVELVK